MSASAQGMRRHLTELAFAVASFGSVPFGRARACTWHNAWLHPVRNSRSLSSKPDARGIPFPPRVVQRPVPNVRHVILVGSGKGGVGKSTVAGPSIPHMMNLVGKRAALTTTEPPHLLPLENHGIKCMSMGFLVDEGKALSWRGPMVGKALEQLLFDVVWGSLDVLVVDLPPGTGDTHITLAQRLVTSGIIIVTTPQAVALADVRRSVQMFRQVKIPVLGVVENMSHFECEACGHRTRVFGEAGGKALAESEQVPCLGRLPLDIVAMSGADTGTPVALAHPERPIATEYACIARSLQSALDIA